jgi:hypothetical protein
LHPALAYWVILLRNHCDSHVEGEWQVTGPCSAAKPAANLIGRFRAWQRHFEVASRQ